jgi:hypothetical protein
MNNNKNLGAFAMVMLMTEMMNANSALRSSNGPTRAEITAYLSDKMASVSDEVYTQIRETAMKCTDAVSAFWLE